MLFNLNINFLLNMVMNPLHFYILITKKICLHFFISSRLFLCLIWSFWFINFLSRPTIFIMFCNSKLIKFNMLTALLERVPFTARMYLIYLMTTRMFQYTTSRSMRLQIWFRKVRIISSRLHLF